MNGAYERFYIDYDKLRQRVFYEIFHLLRLCFPWQKRLLVAKSSAELCDITYVICLI